MCLEHNHDVGASVFALYADNRCPAGAALEQAEKMLDAGANPPHVTNVLHQSNFPVARKGVYNLKHGFVDSADAKNIDEKILNAQIVFSSVGLSVKNRNFLWRM
ncbi:hypothetical protein HELRODRAFT_173153 [Helobdella robusta]|uniref:Uncharacterized protein n=1 Tax=Helobdella robusta TaxID=6412 RepID=T1F6G7_HELRO|nr:hypothetical protein HELRODRAFT_173153 [Helobdella robusta]ESO04077.1 hypothetical protein HELRODRAFT_173153 [Helobdella robusta]